MSTGAQTARTDTSIRSRNKISLVVRVSLALFVVLSITLGWSLLKRGEPPELQAQRLAKTYGIRVEFGDPSTFYTPPYGPSDATAPGFEPERADPELAGVAMGGVEAALRKYPPGFIDKLIDAVFICGTLRMDGTAAGGTAGPAWLVLSAPDDYDHAHIRTLAEFTFHHELSSHVLRHDPTTMQRWSAFAPTNSHFVKAVRETLARGKLADPDPSTGFLSAYGATNPENDFNTYAEMMFADASALVSVARKHDLVRRKVHFVLEIYEQMDSRLHKYFVESGLTSLGR